MKDEIIKLFEEIKEEARDGEVKIPDGDVPITLRILFNIVEGEVKDNIPNLFIKNKDNFYNCLTQYIEKALKFYNLPNTDSSIKMLLSLLFVNITNKEMQDLECYLLKYINFIDDKTLEYQEGSKKTELGDLYYYTDTQSYRQETPYCFKSYFKKGDSKYALPRISFGISDGICYIYAIQNKDSKINEDENYNLEVKQKLRSINSGISKYRNVTPSFVIALSLFISFLKENNINKIQVVTPLPIRQNNRDLTLQHKIKFYSMYGRLEKDQIEILKKELEDKKLNDDYNSTVKFINCFNRLKLHFDNLFLQNLDEEVTIEIINMITKNEFLTEIVKEKER